MVSTKRKAVVNAEADHIKEVETLIEDGTYRTVSEFVRQAMGEKLSRLRQSRVAEAVERYCADGADSDDDDLMTSQALHEPDAAPGKK